MRPVCRYIIHLDIGVKQSIALQLVDTLVGSVLTYGCLVWGFTKYKDIARVHMKFCKYSIGVKQTTINAAVFGELGRFPLYINSLTAIVKYWLKLSNTQHIILQTLFKSMIEDDENGMKHWVTTIKQMLNVYGFKYAFKHPELLNHKHLLHYLNTY